MSAAPQIGDIIKFEIEIVKGPHVGQKYTFEKVSIVIGRGTENDIILDKDPRVSRQHAEIKQSLGEFYLVNLSQRNFVMLNGETVTSEKIPNTAIIQIGDCELKFTADVQVKESEPIAIPTPIVRKAPPASALAVQSNIPSQPPVGMPQNYQQSYQQQYQNQYQQQNPYMNSAGAGQRRAMPQEESKTKFYVIIGAVILLLFIIYNSSKKTKTRDEESFRGSEKVQQDLLEADAAIESLKARKDKLDNLQYRRAQENFIKAFRDYRDGQYGRAKDAFQVVLNLDPDNELAKRYYNLARLKFDEHVKFGIIQGHRYKEKNNFRMCMSSFLNVMNMLQNNRTDPSFIEAERFYKECQLGTEGRF